MSTLVKHAFKVSRLFRPGASLCGPLTCFSQNHSESPTAFNPTLFHSAEQKGRKNNIYHDPPHEISRLFSSLSISTLPHFEVLEGSECLPTCPETSVASAQLNATCGLQIGRPVWLWGSSSLKKCFQLCFRVCFAHLWKSICNAWHSTPFFWLCCLLRVINVGFRGGAWGLPFTLLGAGTRRRLGDYEK